MADLDILDDGDDLLEAATDSYFDPYARESALGIDRDRWDRPLILPDPEWMRTAKILKRAPGRRDPDRVAADLALLKRSNGWPDGEVVKYQLADGRRPYARISSLAAGIDPAFGLGVWKLRHVMLSIARRPDLQELLCTMTYRDGKAIDAVAEEALIRAKDDTAPGPDGPVSTDPEGKLRAAHRGTTFHRATTPGIDSTFGPRLKDFWIAKGKLEAKLEELDLEIVDTERFVVSDALAAAGTYDHLVRDRRTDKVHVLDKKTGKLQWLSHLVQVEGYSDSKHYDPATGRRTPLHPNLDPSLGFIASTNLETGECDIWEMTQLDGDFARLAVDVWEANKADTIKPLVRKRT